MTNRNEPYEIKPGSGGTWLAGETGDLQLKVEVAPADPPARLAVRESITPIANGVRWDIEITGDGEERTAPVEASICLPVHAHTKFWTAWTHGNGEWTDPLASMPLTDESWKYGPFFETGISIPLATVLNAADDTGFSWIVSPDNVLLDVELLTDASGKIRFRFQHYRFGEGHTVRLSMSIVRHEADWRGGLRWMTEQYPAYFEPPNALADAMAGCGSYPLQYDGADKEQLRKMAYRFYWAASYDYPYYGMWMPPVDEEEQWKSWRTAPPFDLSISMLAERARTVRQDGFHYLYYFNCSEFGTFDRKALPDVDVDAPAETNVADEDLWQDGLNYLRKHLSTSLWRDKNGNPSRAGWAPEGYSFVLDPGYGGWQQFLLEQAKRHNRMLPDAAGLCMDRMWWSTMEEQGYRMQPVNFGADDGVGLYGNKRGSHFSESFKRFLDRLGRVMHEDGKVLFFNSCMAYRLDLYKDVDGFYDELWPMNGNPNVNGTALLAMRKPAMMWTNETQLEGDPDRYFQQNLYLGTFVTAPFPTNDHTIRPGTAYDAYFTDYGPLLAAMVGKKWVLEPHCVAVMDDAAKANLFRVDGGWAIPVVFGGTNEAAVVAIRNIPGVDGKMRAKAFLPGLEQAQPVEALPASEGLHLQTPLGRGCAMIVLEKEFE
ncbi:MAG: hypothetical protein J7639_26980 [Paenibacillaceae bacterium]|nr:hypothetical protein [Paenibacillaceae bacterium]